MHIYQFEFWPEDKAVGPSVKVLAFNSSSTRLFLFAPEVEFFLFVFFRFSTLLREVFLRFCSFHSSRKPTFELLCTLFN